MNFMTVDMAKALTERLAHAPKIREVMSRIYVAALQGKLKSISQLRYCPAKRTKLKLQFSFQVWGIMFGKIHIIRFVLDGKILPTLRSGHYLDVLRLNHPKIVLAFLENI